MTVDGRPSVWLTTLGCAKNQVDSDKVAGRLAAAGYRAADSPADADVVMVNTCAFIEEARRESIDTILDHASRRRPGTSLVVIGCMAQRYQAELAEALPEADAVVGMERYGTLVDTLDTLTGWSPVRLRTDPMDILFEVHRPAPDTPYAYVKVAEGCDKPCTFCAIPRFRGRQRSRSPVDVRSEIAALTAAGVSEVVLVAQDLGAYGRDLTAPGGIVDLLTFCADVDGLRALRLLYLHPREVTDGLVAAMTTSDVVVPYFDLSLQHAVPRLLRAMKRPGSGERFADLIGRIRAARPDAALRSSFIAGFPGETDDDVDDLAAFLREVLLDWAGFFPYSPEEGTPAATLHGRVPAAEAAARARHLQEVQEAISASRNAAVVGRTLDVLVDQVEDGVPVGRSYREAPEIDGVVTLDAGAPGQWVTATVTASYGTDLAAAVVR